MATRIMEPYNLFLPLNTPGDPMIFESRMRLLDLIYPKLFQPFDQFYGAVVFRCIGLQRSAKNRYNVGECSKIGRLLVLFEWWLVDVLDSIELELRAIAFHSSWFMMIGEVL